MGASSARVRRPALSHAVHHRGAFCPGDGDACASVAMAQGRAMGLPWLPQTLLRPQAQEWGHSQLSLLISKGLLTCREACTLWPYLLYAPMLPRSSVPTCGQHGHQSSTAFGTA